MSDERSRSQEAESERSDPDGRLAVAAHSLLSSVMAIRGAIDLATTSEPDDANREMLLAMALRRLDQMAETLRGLTIGLDDAFTLGLARLGHPSVVDLHEGTRVEVHSSFNDTWAVGFEIAEVVRGGYRVRRISDGTLLPGHTSTTDLRLAVNRRSE